MFGGFYFADTESSNTRFYHRNHRVVLVGRDLQDGVVPLKGHFLPDRVVQRPVQAGFVLFPMVTVHFSVSQQGRVLGVLRGVRGERGDARAPAAMHGLAPSLFL